MTASAATDSQEDVKGRNSATWKFEFADTVQADPLAKGECLAVIRCYLHFASVSDPKAFCSLSELMLRSACSRPAILRAKATLERLGYLVPLYTTDEGATMYRVVNARKEVIDEHLRHSRQELADAKRDRKRRERKSKKHGGNETIPPETDNFERNDTPVLNETLPNTVDEYRRGYSYEEGQWGVEGNSSYSSAHRGDESTSLIPIPRDDAEADQMIDVICEGISVEMDLRIRLTEMLVAGVLSPNLASKFLYGERDAA
jgi:hypothetical protein